jgi:hypothetical protein
MDKKFMVGLVALAALVLGATAPLRGDRIMELRHPYKYNLPKGINRAEKGRRMLRRHNGKSQSRLRIRRVRACSSSRRRG